MLLTNALALSYVPRWSVVRHSRPQSVADHSFRVAIIYVELNSRLHGMAHPSTVKLFDALIHDIDEAVTGDMPSFSKSHAEPKDKLLKVADLIEAYTYISMYGQGPHAAEIAISTRGSMYERCLKWGIPTDVVADICKSIMLEEGRAAATTTTTYRQD